jgi:hypothetical protein
MTAPSRTIARCMGCSSRTIASCLEGELCTTTMNDRYCPSPACALVIIDSCYAAMAATGVAGRTAPGWQTAAPG